MPRRSAALVSSIIVVALVMALGATAVAAQSQRALAVKVTMTGDQEVVGTTCAPPEVCGDPDATGTARVLIVPAIDRVCFRLDWTDIDGTVWGGHIHGPATRQEAAPVVIPLFMMDPADPSTHLDGTDAISGCVTSSTWADAVAADPASFYVNVHSTVYGPGAIRAQLGG